MSHRSGGFSSGFSRGLGADLSGVSGVDSSFGGGSTRSGDANSRATHNRQAKAKAAAARERARQKAVTNTKFAEIAKTLEVLNPVSQESTARFSPAVSSILGSLFSGNPVGRGNPTTSSTTTSFSPGFFGQLGNRISAGLTPHNAFNIPTVQPENPTFIQKVGLLRKQAANVASQNPGLNLIGNALLPTGVTQLLDAIVGSQQPQPKNLITFQKLPNLTPNASQPVAQTVSPSQFTTAVPTPFRDFRSGGGNVQRFTDFATTPTFAGIPTIDPTASLNAFQNAIAGIDSIVNARGLTGQGFAQEARNKATGIFDAFKAGDAFDTLLNNQIGQQFANTALTNTQQNFIDTGTQNINTAFPGDAFQSLDQSIIDSIVNERTGSARKQISNVAARGNLSPLGSKTANETITGQTQAARDIITSAGNDVLGANRNTISGIKDQATTANQDFVLGQPAFDVTPFAQQRANTVSDKTNSFTGDVSSVLGTQPLFNVSDAITSGGRSQGVVSGATPNSSFLDAIATRQQANNTSRRGLGTRGSGVF